MNPLLNHPAFNLVCLLIGAALQGISMFQIQAIEPFRAGILSFALVLLTLGQWSKIKGTSADAAKVVGVLVLISALGLAGCATVAHPPDACPGGAQTEASIRDDVSTAMASIEWKSWSQWLLKCFGIPLVKATVLTLMGELEHSVEGGASDQATLEKLDHMKLFVAEQGWAE